jgi:hypothetical protein
MPAMKDQYSVREKDKPEEDRVYHNNSSCGPFSEIHKDDRRDGRNSYRLCKDCKKINDDGK